MNIKSTFSIKDLENLSGVKAHTIRIWEKRYQLFNPERSDTNIRNYGLKELTKLLNIAVLLDNGNKISRVSELNDEELKHLVQTIAINKHDPTNAIQTFKLSMLNFDQGLFEKTYNQLLTQYSFRDIFYKVFIQLLDEIGVLWMTETITPAHEHFITVLIQQKMLYNIEKVQNNHTSTNKVFVLFLPMNEIHELGLLYIHFELLLKGYKSIYLGQSVPTESLENLEDIFPKINFISYFTVSPIKEEISSYIQDFDERFLKDKDNSLTILGRLSQELELDKKCTKIKTYNSIKELVEKV